MSSKQPDVGKNDVRWADLRRKLIVRPTLAGFGTVVADCAACDPSVDYAGCIVVNLTPEYERGFKCGIGDEVAYSMSRVGPVRVKYYTVDPGTQGT